MYVDIGILLVFLVIVIVFFRKFSSFVYAIAIMDIFFRIMAFIKNNTVKEVHDLIGKYLPESIGAIIHKYTSGVLCTILMWVYVIFFCIFLYYIVCYFISKKK